VERGEAIHHGGDPTDPPEITRPRGYEPVIPVAGSSPEPRRDGQAGMRGDRYPRVPCDVARSPGRHAGRSGSGGPQTGHCPGSSIAVAPDRGRSERMRHVSVGIRWRGIESASPLA